MIIPSIDLMDGKAIEMLRGDEARMAGDDPVAIAKRLSIAGRLTVIDMDAALGKGDNAELIRRMLKLYPCRVGGGIRDADTAVAWLDAGARKVIIGTAADAKLLSSLPRERTIAAVDVKNGEVVVDGGRRRTGQDAIERICELRDHTGEMLVTLLDREGGMGGIDMAFVERVMQAAGKNIDITVGGGIVSAEEISKLDRMGADAQVGSALLAGELDLADAIMAPLKTDRPDGLFATIVTDETGQTLGLVYSDRESIKEAVRRKCGAYHSRTRGLWVKGLTSGNVQELIEIALDCDRDAMRFTVKQGGEGFCHKHTWTCFGEDRGLANLFRRIESRKTNAPDESYTKRLLADSRMLKEKLVEEAEELAAANSPNDVVSEAADLVYFTFTALVRAGVGLHDLEHELYRRSLKLTRRQGDPKKKRS